METKELKPFIKWAGGKRYILPELLKNMPKKIGTYYEPFVGGGALLFAVQPENFVINDLNIELMSAYKCFSDETLYTCMMEKLEEHSKNNSAEYYNKIRDDYKDKNLRELPIVEIAARFIYLNKTCFNGLYRVNSRGNFNVPYDKNRKKYYIYNKELFDSISEFLTKNNKNKILSTDYIEVVKDAKKGDFVYFDPPYDGTFSSYTSEKFKDSDQLKLATLCYELDKKGVKFMVSNSNTEYVRNLYRKFKIKIVESKSSISRSNTGRGKVEEVIITNY